LSQASWLAAVLQRVAAPEAMAAAIHPLLKLERTLNYQVERLRLDPKVQNFVKAFQTKYGGKSPDAFAALGYDSAYFIADAIKRAGSSDPQKIKKALSETKNLSLVSGKVTLDQNHDPIKSAVILEYKDGKQTFNSKVNP
jgi:ABC-type branched-subunit amino acid transport system substrate-binding protein